MPCPHVGAPIYRALVGSNNAIINCSSNFLNHLLSSAVVSHHMSYNFALLQNRQLKMSFIAAR